MNRGAEARRYLRARRQGLLSTVSRKFPGYPYGSVVPFVLDPEARPILLVSRLAEHTRNIDADGRVSLLAHDAVENVQAGARLTLMGDAARIEAGLDGLRARYLNYFPDVARHLALGDFMFYRIEPRHLRYIGGFGDIHWVAVTEYAPATSGLAEQQADILQVINAGHARTLRECCRVRHQRDTKDAILIGIDCDGFDVRADGDLLRLDTEQPITDSSTARKALLAMAGDARAS